MCGRYVEALPPVELESFLDASIRSGHEIEWHPSWNVAPTDTVLGASLEEGERLLDAYRWGLLPSWAKDPKAAAKAFNARAESVADKPMYRAAFRSRRLLVPASGYYEWKRLGRTKQPYYFERSDGEPIVFAGLWEVWRPAKEAPWVRSCTIITTDAGDDERDIHNRMPVILERATWDDWLDPEFDLDHAKSLLVPSPPRTLTKRPVDPRVGNIANNSSDLLRPLG